MTTISFIELARLLAGVATSGRDPEGKEAPDPPEVRKWLSTLTDACKRFDAPPIYSPKDGMLMAEESPGMPVLLVVGRITLEHARMLVQRVAPGRELPELVDQDAPRRELADLQEASTSNSVQTKKQPKETPRTLELKRTAHDLASRLWDNRDKTVEPPTRPEIVALVFNQMQGMEGARKGTKIQMPSVEKWLRGWAYPRTKKSVEIKTDHRVAQKHYWKKERL